MRTLITGATGFIGSALSRRLQRTGHEVWALSRGGDSATSHLPAVSRAFAWDPMAGPAPAEAFEGVEAVVHLAGESVAGRWTRARREAIEQSRVVGTTNLVAAIEELSQRPRVLVSSSAIGYYGDRGEESLTEQSHSGDDFLARVSREWEAAARGAEGLGVSVVRLRTGIVLGHGGGALKEMLPPAKLGLGGPLGSGRQWWSWIHLEDAIGIIEHALTLNQSTALNGTAPVPVRQIEFAKTLGGVLKRPAFMPAPAFVLKLVLGGFAVELLSSKRVLPEATRASGYDFRFAELGPALADILG